MPTGLHAEPGQRQRQQWSGSLLLRLLLGQQRTQKARQGGGTHLPRLLSLPVPDSALSLAEAGRGGWGVPPAPASRSARDSGSSGWVLEGGKGKGRDLPLSMEGKTRGILTVPH